MIVCSKFDLAFFRSGKLDHHRNNDNRQSTSSQNHSKNNNYKQEVQQEFDSSEQFNNIDVIPRGVPGSNLVISQLDPERLLNLRGKMLM